MEIQPPYEMDGCFKTRKQWEWYKRKFIPQSCLCHGIKPTNRDYEKTLKQIFSIILALIIFQRLKLYEK